MERSMHEATAVLSPKMTTCIDDKEHPLLTVYIWDMDETLILLKSLLDGTYARFFNGSKDLKKGVEIGKYWEDYILKVSDEHFFYEQIENLNEPSLDSLSEYDDGRDLLDYDFKYDSFTYPYDDLSKRKLSYRYPTIAQRYVKMGLDRWICRKAHNPYVEILGGWVQDVSADAFGRWVQDVSANASVETCSATAKTPETNAR